MKQCQAAPSRAVSLGWKLTGTLPNGQWFNSCAADGGFGLRGVSNMGYNTGGALELDVPSSHPGVTISHVEADVTTAPEYLDNPYGCCDVQYSFFRLAGGGAQIVYDQEMKGWSEHIGRNLPAGARDFEMAIYCSYGNGPQNCVWKTDPVISTSTLELQLQESIPPTAQATGGTLISGGTASGTQTLSYTANDGDSGVHDVSVQVGGTTVATDSYAKRCTNDDWSACPLSEDRAELSIDTKQVPDGTYPLKFIVTDAAGNTATVDSGRTVTVDNARANGPGAVGKTTTVQLVLGQGRTGALRTIYGRKLVITGQALTSDSKPVSNAPIDVSSQLAQAGNDFADIGETQTDGNGAFAFAVPPGPNRTLRFSYTSPPSAGEQARGQTDVVIQVRATAHLTPNAHKVGGGRRVTFRGQLKGGPIPASGVPIGFRGQVGRHVRKFADTQTDARGHFRLSYRFGVVGPRKATYPIWVRIGADGDDYPYLPGLSNRVHITVVR
jgi:hypothetical protein